MGKIDGLWVVSSSSNTLDLPLKKLAKQRISKRGEPEFDSFDSYMEIRKSCWIIDLFVWVTKKVNEKSHPRLEQFLLVSRGRGVVLKA